MCDAKDSLWLILRLGQARVYFAGVDRCEDEKLVAPDNRGGTAVTLDRRLPLDVVGWAPLDGRLGRGGDSVGIRSAPVMPVVRLGLLKLIRMRLAMEKHWGDQGKRCDRGAIGFFQCHFRHLIALNPLSRFRILLDQLKSAFSKAFAQCLVSLGRVMQVVLDLFALSIDPVIEVIRIHPAKSGA